MQRHGYERDNGEIKRSYHMASSMYAPEIDTIVCSRSVGRGLRAEVYVIVECSYFAYTSRTVCP